MSEHQPSSTRLADREEWLEYRVNEQPQTYDAHQNGRPLFEMVDAEVNYLESPSDQLQRMSEKLAQTYPELEKRLRSNLEKGRELGFVPDEVDERRLEMLFWTAAVNVVEKDALGEDRTGEYEPLNDVITVSGGESLGETNRVLTHELRHRLAGGTFQEIGENGIWRTRIGFVNERVKEADGSTIVGKSEAGDRRVHEALDEAVNEHVTQALIFGNWETIRPSHRSGDIGVYENEREALGVLIDKSQGQMNLKTLVRASFEDTTSKGGVTERRQMVREMHDSYEIGTFHRFDQMMVLAEQLRDKDVHIYPDNLPIIAPVIKGGIVMRKGYIDLDIMRQKLNKSIQITGEPLI